MKTIIFYEKPGCSSNARQKTLLKAAGYVLDERDLLTHPWTTDALRIFFGNKAVADWFNRAAPRIKSGEIVPESMDAGAALAAMLADPLLIRRPLIQLAEQRMAGFDAEVEQQLGLARRVEHMEGCSSDTPCRPNEGRNDSP